MRDSVSSYRLTGIHGAPRSGTTWLGELFNSHEHVAYRYQPFFSYAFRGRINECSTAGEMRRSFDDLLLTDDEFVCQTGSARLAKSSPQFAKGAPTHLVYKEVRFHDLIKPIIAALPDAKYIGIVRDPLSVLESWLGAPREFKPEWSIRTEWRWAPLKNAGLAENWFGYERWKQLAGLYLELAARDRERFRIVRYEEIVAAPVPTVESLFRFCGLQMGEQTVRFIADSTTGNDDEDPYGVFRSTHRPPRSARLPAEIGDWIRQDLRGTDLEQFLI
jgi:hypothetical protein